MKDKKDEKQLETVERSQSEVFTSKVMHEFKLISGQTVEFSQNQKRLAQHMFVKIDSVIKTLEAKRIADNKQQITPYTWNNINVQKMAVDSVHRIEIGLDPLIDNHLSIIPYFNKKLKVYDLDLRIGYVGKDFYKRKMAYDTPIDIIYELVYSNDTFDVLKKDFGNKVESYNFKIEKPFDRGEIVGGFGYIIFSDETKNKLVIVTEQDFKKSKEQAQSKAFWDKHPDRMRYKTIVNKTTAKLMIDPDKMNESYFHVENSEKEEPVGVEESDQIIDIEPESLDEAETETIKDKKEPAEKTVNKRKANF